MEQQTFIEEKETSSGFDVNRFFSKLARNYYWFILTILLFGSAAFLFLRYTQPHYEVSTYILIKQPNDAISSLGGSPFAAPGTVSNSPEMLGYLDPANEIFKLKSEALMGEVVDSLNLELYVEKVGRVKNKPQFLDSVPFTVAIKKVSADNRFTLDKVTLNTTDFTFVRNEKKIRGIYGQPFLMNGDTVTIGLKPEGTIGKEGPYKIEYLSRGSAVSRLASRIDVLPAPKAGAGMLQISVRDELPRRAKSIIDVLITVYDRSNLEFKNKALRSEIAFLNDRVNVIGNELLRQENMVRDFKVEHRVQDVSASANQLLVSLTALDQKKSENESKKYLANLVENTIRNFSGQEQVVSNASGLGDGVLTNLVGKYNEKVLEKKRILDKGTSLDPRLPSIDRELQDLRSSILSSVANIKSEIAVNDQYLAAQERNTTSRFSSMPEKEKDYVQVNRLLNLKQTMYIFLLQRKEDKHIQLISSQEGESRVIDSRISNDILFPKPIVIYGIAIGLALLLPAMIVLIRMLLNKKIETRKDIEKATTIPIAGEIEMEPKTAKEIIVSAGYRSDISEQFRTLRTNLMYLGQGNSSKVVMVTSSITGEGKSFVSLNLAHSLALTGKKVILVELDLRKPQLAKTVNLKKTPGVTDYIITTSLRPEDIIQTHEKYENLSFLTSGPIPPNPAELILSKRVDGLIEYLKKQYDYIILDSPPVGIVSDPIIIGKWAEVTLFVVRHNYSYRSSMELLNELKTLNKLPNISIVINSIQRNKGFHKEIKDSYKYYQEDSKKKSGKESEKDFSLS